MCSNLVESEGHTIQKSLLSITQICSKTLKFLCENLKLTAWKKRQRIKNKPNLKPLFCVTLPIHNMFYSVDWPQNTFAAKSALPYGKKLPKTPSLPLSISNPSTVIVNIPAFFLFNPQGEKIKINVNNCSSRVSPFFLNHHLLVLYVYVFVCTVVYLLPFSIIFFWHSRTPPPSPEALKLLPSPPTSYGFSGTKRAAYKWAFFAWKATC